MLHTLFIEEVMFHMTVVEAVACCTDVLLAVDTVACCIYLLLQ